MKSFHLHPSSSLKKNYPTTILKLKCKYRLKNCFTLGDKECFICIISKMKSSHRARAQRLDDRKLKIDCTNKVLLVQLRVNYVTGGKGNIHLKYEHEIYSFVTNIMEPV